MLKLAGGGAASTGGMTLGGAVSSLLVTSETGNRSAVLMVMMSLFVGRFCSLVPQGDTFKHGAESSAAFQKLRLNRVY